MMKNNLICFIYGFIKRDLMYFIFEEKNILIYKIKFIVDILFVFFIN